MSSPVNPYQPSAHASEPFPGRPVSNDLKSPYYRARLTWADRQILLRSIGPTRIAMLVSGLLWAKSIYDLVNRLRRWADSPLFQGELLGWIMVVVTVATISQGALTIYGCWLGWLSADRLQAVVGGREESWQKWSHLHYRTAWIGAVSSLMGLAIQVGHWLVSQAIAYQAASFS